MTLTRPNLRKLRVGKSASAAGVVYTKLDGDGRWSINVMVNRVRHHVVVGLESEGYTKTQCEDLISNLRAKKRERGHGVGAPKHRTRWSIAKAAEDYITYLREHGGKDADGKEGRFERHITPKLGNIDINKLTEEDWSRYASARRGEGASDGTINREQAALLHMLRTAVRRKLIQAVPCQLAKFKEAPGKILYLSPKQTRELIKAAENDQSEHTLTFVMISAHTGMRHSPILNLRARDIDCDRRIIWIGKDKAGKREQAMPQILADYLRPLVQIREPGDLVFASARAKSGRVYQINSRFARCVERAGLPREVTPHTMRHTMATNAAHAGLDAGTIQALGGWKTRAMAERYTHAASLHTAMDALESQLHGRTVTQKLHRARRKVS